MMHRKFRLPFWRCCSALSVPALAAGRTCRLSKSAERAARRIFRRSVQQLVCSRGAGRFRRGVMNGTGRRASPEADRLLGTGRCIAVRIHAACNDGEIAEAGGAWYEPYVAYATEAKLLPSTCPDGSAVTAKTITRQELAGLFAKMCCAQRICPRSTTRPSRI